MAIAKKYLERVEREYRDYDGYWIELRRGWKNGDDPVGVCHGIHENTRRDALKVLTWSIPCDCRECR